MDIMEFLAHHTNIARHNLFRRNELPAGTPQPLGYGLKFCVKPASINDIISHTFNLLEKYIRKLWAQKALYKDENYNPSTCLKSN